MFIVLYPSGISSEVALAYLALPYIKVLYRQRPAWPEGGSEVKGRVESGCRDGWERG